VKEKIIYISSFIVVFVIVTIGIIYFNSEYQDIFHFNFAKTKTVDHKEAAIDTTSIQLSELKVFLKQQLKGFVLDSLKTYVTKTKTDTVINKVVIDSSLLDSLKNLKNRLNKTNLQLAKQNATTKKLEKILNKQPDSMYVSWTKKIAKLYETMDPSKAAKIIQGYSDNIARDIIYTMKQKKAAGILAEFNPKIANRIMRAK